MNMAAIVDEFDARIGQLVALELWRVGGIKVNIEEPYRLVSGRLSPIYINCRELISSSFFIDLFVAAARFYCVEERFHFDVLAGGETAGIPFAAFLAHALGKPMVYVRKAPKDHGVTSRVEGVLTGGARVLLVEDLITDAGSKLSFVDALHDSGAQVNDVFVVFDREQGGSEALEKRAIKLHALTNLHTALAIGEQVGFLEPSIGNAVKDYLSDPNSWSSGRGMNSTEDQKR